MPWVEVANLATAQQITNAVEDSWSQATVSGTVQVTSEPHMPTVGGYHMTRTGRVVTLQIGMFEWRSSLSAVRLTDPLGNPLTDPQFYPVGMVSQFASGAFRVPNPTYADVQAGRDTLFWSVSVNTSEANGFELGMNSNKDISLITDITMMSFTWVVE